MLYTSMDCWVCWIVVNVLLTVTCVSVSGVFGHDDAERAHRQTSFEAVSVSARAPGSQLPWKGEGGVRVFTLKFPRVVFLKENVIYFSFFWGLFFFFSLRCEPLPWLFWSACTRRTISGTTSKSLPWTTCSSWFTPTLRLCSSGPTKTQVCLQHALSSPA